MLKFISTFLMLVIGSTAFAGPRILFLVDIDDTLKPTMIRGSLLTKGYRHFFTSDGFVGMREILQHVDQHVDAEIAYVTNTPTFLTWPHKRFLKTHGYPQSGNIYPRNVRELISETIEKKRARGGSVIPAHKLKQDIELISSESWDAVVSLGDNGEHDADLFHELTGRYSDIPQITMVRNAYWDGDNEAFPHIPRFLTPLEIIYQLRRVMDLPKEGEIIRRLTNLLKADPGHVFAENNLRHSDAIERLQLLKSTLKSVVKRGNGLDVNSDEVHGAQFTLETLGWAKKPWLKCFDAFRTR